MPVKDATIRRILNEYKSPFYLYDQEILLQSIRQLYELSDNRVTLLYSVKANPLLYICRLMKQSGCGLEVSSQGEIYLAIKAGVEKSRIYYSGPGKTVFDIQYAIEKGVGIISVESVDELNLINTVALNKNIIQPVFIRINPNYKSKGLRFSMTGVSSQFGIDEEVLNDNFFDEINLLDNIQVVGIHVYFGTQNLDINSIIQNTEYIFRLAIRLEQKYSIHFKYINLGGGFGVDYFPNESSLDMIEFKHMFLKLLDKYHEYLQSKNIIMESGRFLTANAGMFITKVLYVKESKGKTFVICDGGSNFHASSAFLGRFIRNNFPIRVLGKNHTKTKPCTIVGPLCTPTDILGQDYNLPIDISKGDYIIIEKSGAYGLTNSPLKFLSFNTPAELLVDQKGQIRCMRHHGKPEDVLRDQMD